MNHEVQLIKARKRKKFSMSILCLAKVDRIVYILKLYGNGGEKRRNEG